MDEVSLIVSDEVHLLNDAIVIADLSDQNPNVYYELAIRHVIKKPYIHIIEIGQKIPFDIFATRTIYYDYKDLEMVEKVKKDLEDQIRFAEENPEKIDSPVSYSFNLSLLSKSTDRGDKNIVSVISLIQNLQLEMSHFTSNVQAELKEIKQHIYTPETGVAGKGQARDISKLNKIQKELGIQEKDKISGREDEDE